MEEHAERTLAKAAPSPERPFRFGITDLMAAAILFGAQLSAFRAIIPNFVMYRDDDRLIALAFIVAAYTFGAAYLCGRLLTEKKWRSFAARIGALVMIDAGLVGGTVLFVLSVKFLSPLLIGLFMIVAPMVAFYKVITNPEADRDFWRRFFGG